MDDFNYCTLQCNWIHQEEIEKLKCRTIFREENGNEHLSDNSSEPSEDVNNTNFTGSLVLNQTEDGQSCYLRCECVAQYNKEMVAVDVISDSRIMEVYGKFQEYITSSQGTYVGEDNDSAMYMTQYCPETPCQDCCLKLIPIKGCHQIHLHSVHITISQCSTRASGFNAKRVRDMLKSMGTELTPLAKASLSAMEKTRGCSSSNMADLMSSMMSTLNCSPSTPLQGSMQSSWQQTMTSPTSMAAKDYSEKYHSHDMLNNSSSGETASGVSVELEQYLQHMEERIVEQVNQKLSGIEQRIVTKVDSILSHLTINNGSID